jgi:hypothetical protein
VKAHPNLKFETWADQVRRYRREARQTHGQENVSDEGKSQNHRGKGRNRVGATRGKDKVPRRVLRGSSRGNVFTGGGGI